MTDRHYLVLSSEDHVMLSHDGTAADCRNTNLLRVSLLMTGAAVIGIMIAVFHRLVDGICQSQGCSAWSVQLPVMVLLNDLDVKTGIR